MYGSAVLATKVRAVLPEHHLSNAAQDVVSRGTGFVVTLAALVLGLLIAAGNSAYNDVAAKLQATAEELILVDHSLAKYGSETGPIRDLLRQSASSGMHRIWPDADLPFAPTTGSEPARVTIEKVEGMILELRPDNEVQRTLQARALRGIDEIKQNSWLLIELHESKIPAAFLVILVLWLMIAFFGFGLFAPENLTINIALLLWAFCAASALFLILELFFPMGGLLAISPEAFQTVLRQLGR